MKIPYILGVILLISVFSTIGYSALQIDQTVNLTSLLSLSAGDTVNGITYDGTDFILLHANGTPQASRINGAFDTVTDNCQFTANTLPWGVTFNANGTSILTNTFRNSTTFRKFEIWNSDLSNPNCAFIRAQSVSFSANTLGGMDLFREISGTYLYDSFIVQGSNSGSRSRLSADFLSTNNFPFTVGSDPAPLWTGVAIQQDSLGDGATATHLWYLSGETWSSGDGGAPDRLVKIELNIPPNNPESVLYSINLSENGISGAKRIEFDFNDHIWIINDTTAVKLNITAFEEDGFGASSITFTTPSLNNTNFNFELETIKATISVASNDTCDLTWEIDDIVQGACIYNLTNATTTNVFCNQDFIIGNHTSKIQCASDGIDTIDSTTFFSVNLGFTGNIGITIRESLGLQTAEQGTNVWGLLILFVAIVIGFIVGGSTGGLAMTMAGVMGLGFIGWLDITIVIIVIIVSGFMLAKTIAGSFFNKGGL